MTTWIDAREWLPEEYKKVLAIAEGKKWASIAPVVALLKGDQWFIDVPGNMDGIPLDERFIITKWTLLPNNYK